MIGVVAGIAERCLCPFLDSYGCGRCKESTDVDCHVEDGKGRIALAGQLRRVVEVAHHHLQVAFEQSCSEADEEQGCQHGDERYCSSAQGDRQEEVTGKHDYDSDGYHLAIAELVGHDAADQWKKINEA